MANSIVVKVKYGETLRRFNANLNEAGQLELDIGGLREKIVGLLNLAPSSDISITYIDEDGDVVALVDEDDLRDVITQSLDPLRLTVKCNAGKDGSSYARSSGSSTPMRSPRIKHPLENLNSGVSEVLKTVPDPLLDLATKAASSLPGFVNLVDSLTKMGQSHVDGSKAPSSVPGLGDLVDSLTKIGQSNVDVSKVASSVLGLADLVDSMAKMGQSHVDGSKSGDQNVASGSGVGGSNSKTEVSGGSRDGKASLESTTKANLVDKDNVMNVPATNRSNGTASLSGFPWLPVDGKSQVTEVGKPGGNIKVGKKSTGKCQVTEVGKPGGNIKVGKKLSFFTPGVYPACAVKDPVVDSGTTNVGGNAQFPDLNRVNECPFTGMPVQRAPVATSPQRSQPQFGARVHPFKRSYTQNDGLNSIFHRGVRCDGCGVHPITGPRFKSQVKEDYDLCSICFSQMGNAMDYIRMDRPASYHHSHSFRGGDAGAQFRIPTVPHVLRAAGLRSSRPKLDSRFVKDVNVMDGTMMAPSTPFTKIWRMKNNGTIVWPRGSQLFWIGGDQLSNSQNVELQVQEDGVPVDSELDIAVDFTAPKSPGRYISYWRMASPSGQKFGQRVWVLIQVDTSLEDSLLDSYQGLNLNLPPQGSNEAGPEYNIKLESVSVEPKGNEVESLLGASSDKAPELVEPLVANSGRSAESIVAEQQSLLRALLGASSDKATELVEPLVANSGRSAESVVAGPARFENEKLPFPGYLLFGAGGPSRTPPAVEEAPKSAAQYPVVDTSTVEKAESSNAVDGSASREVPVTTSVEEDGGSELELSLLRELDSMGFRQADLNKEILRINDYDLEKSVDDLCGVTEWDPILEELNEMGFIDTEVNKRLLKKNNGSIKGVVMDLITGEKE